MTNNCESIYLIHFWWSSTKEWGSKRIRYPRSPLPKRCQLVVGACLELYQNLSRYESLWALGGVRSQGRNLKELTERHHQGWSVRLNLTQRGKPYQGKTSLWLTDWLFFLDSVGGGAWPILVGGVTRLVNFDNERDPSCLVGHACLGRYESPIWTVSFRLKEVSG